MRRLAALALVLAAAAAACKGDPPAKPAAATAPAPTTATAPVAPIHVTHGDPTPSAPAPAASDESPAPPPPAQLAVPMAQDPATLKKQVAKMDEVIERTQAAYDQATDKPSRHKAGTLLQAMRKRRNDLAAHVGIAPIKDGSGSATGPAPDPSAPAP
jgi:hypothetical protein